MIHMVVLKRRDIFLLFSQAASLLNIVWLLHPYSPINFLVDRFFLKK